MRAISDLLTTRGRAFGSAGVTLLLAGYALGFRDLTRIAVLLLTLPLLAALLGRRRPPGLVVHRDTEPVRVVADDVATVVTTVHNTGSRATPIMLAEERIDYLLGERPRALLGSLSAGEARALTYAVRPPLRGRHLLGPLTVQLRDPFGLTMRFVDVGEATELVVVPRTFPLGGGRPRGTGVGADGEIPFMIALHGEDDQSIREYRDGDDLRRIHWPATARTGELMVRQEDRPARRRAVVLLDPRAEAHRGSGPGSSFEWAVSAAASVAVHLSGLGYAVHLLTPETVEDGHADLATDDDRVLDALAVTQPAPGGSLAPLVRAGQGLVSGGGLVVAVVVGDDEQQLRSLAALRHPGSAALALVLDADSFAGQPAAGSQAADLVRAGGWRVAAVTAGDRVTEAWSQLAAQRTGEVAAR